ncbi:MAG: agmatine deiminase family protein [Bacteroidia bacterium]
MKALRLLAIGITCLFINKSIGQSIILDTPPDGSSRTAAEWEEIQALVVTWRDYKATLAEIIRYAQEECKVIVHATNAATAQNELTNTYNVPIGPNVVFVSQPNNSLWIRDYGANTVYMNDVDSLFLVDWKYNRPSRVQDDSIPRRYARELDLNLVQTTLAPNRLVHTGGNFMSDGFGTAFSSNLILDENTDKTEAQIDAIMENYMGINRYIKMEVLPYDGIHHIDMHMKLLDEETLLWAQYPNGVADGPQIEANLLYVLDNFNSVFGTPYKIVRVVAPPDYSGNGTPIYPNNSSADYRTYSNSVFVNKTVLLPVYEGQFDTTAVRIYQENLPGYRIVPIDCRDIIGASGAIHCITHSVGVNDPLLISHQRLTDTYDTQNPYPVQALMQHRSGINSAQLYYTTDTLAGFTAVNLEPGFVNDTYLGAIPPQSAGTTGYYYLRGASESGKVQIRPITAPNGWFSFRVIDTNDVTKTHFQEALDVFQLKAFPNPASGIVCIPVTVEAGQDIQLELLDLNGRIVQGIHTGTVSAGENRFYIDASKLSSGAYCIKASTRFGAVNQKLIIAH